MTSDAGKSEFWQERWTAGRTGWDLGGAHPNLPVMLELAHGLGLPQAAKVYAPGSGRAHDGAAMAKLGMDVVATDLIASAVDEAKSVYDKLAGLRLAQDDALQPAAVPAGSQDAVFDRAVLCALPPEQRAAYRDACAKVLKPGGLFLSFPFITVEGPPGAGPPFAIAMPELTELMKPRFDLVHAENRPSAAVSGKNLGEMLTIWRRHNDPSAE